MGYALALALARVALQESVEVLDGEGLRPLGALRLPAVGLDHVDDRLGLRAEEPPEVALATADPAEVEDRVGGRLGLEGVALAETVERDPRRRDPAPRNDTHPQRLLARERLDVEELRAVVDSHAVGGQPEADVAGRAYALAPRLVRLHDAERDTLDEGVPQFGDP